MNKLYCLLVFLPFLLTVAAQAQQKANFKRTFYIVRHAEKDTGTNPAISSIGKERAADLFKKLKNKKIDLIMVTNYRRTAMTGDSLRIYKKIDTLHYGADESGELFSRKLSTLPARYKNILVIGHSNTVPGILRQLGVQYYTAKDLPDNEYDNLFVVKRKKRQMVLHSKKYGKSALPAAHNTPMKISQ